MKESEKKKKHYRKQTNTQIQRRRYSLGALKWLPMGQESGRGDTRE
jgi:hypothetical protein